MNLKPELLSALTTLGVTDDELPILFDRMMSLVIGLNATITALDAQIETLSSQRSEAVARLGEAQAIAAKLLVPADDGSLTPFT